MFIKLDKSTIEAIKKLALNSATKNTAKFILSDLIKASYGRTLNTLITLNYNNKN